MHARDRVGARTGAGLRGERAVSLAVWRSGREPPAAVGFSDRSRRSGGPVIHAGDHLAGGSGTGIGKPREPGRGARASERGSGEFSTRRAAAQVAGGKPEARGGTAAGSGGAGNDVGRSGEEEKRRAAGGARKAEAFGTSAGATAPAEAAPAGNSPPGGAKEKPAEESGGKGWPEDEGTRRAGGG